jgi:YegS/Rv2252/BmrU family lipid kinase
LTDPAVFLVNPASDNGATGKRWPQLAHAAAGMGLSGDALLSERPDHLAELARTAVDGGARLLVVVGGDGSVNEVVNGIAGRDVTLAVIPRGTGWDFARSHRLPRRLEDAVAVALGGETRDVDLGRACYRSWAGADEERWFANAASVGMSGAIAKRANETTKALGGKASYLLATLGVFARWHADVVRVAVDDSVREGRMHDVIVAVGPYLGGGMKLCPDAEADDGVFDVLLIGDLTKRDLVLTLPKTYRGTHLPHPKAEVLRGATAAVESAARVPVQLDGEQPGTTPVRFELVPRALRLRVAGTR